MACGLIQEVGSAGAELAVFPEAFLPGYPLWVWFVPPGDTLTLREAYADLVEQAVTIPSPITDQLGAAARAAGVHVAIGLNERNDDASGTTLYNTILYVDAGGRIAGKHRKLIPTTGERLVWAQGDGSTLDVYDLPIGRLGGLICWENYMPLARYAMWARGAQLFAAPTWDHGEPWLSTLRHVAKEGRVYVIGCGTPLRLEHVPDRYSFKQKYLSEAAEWLNPGDSMIVDPDGKILAGPLSKEDGILYAEVDPRAFRGPRFQLDVAGHYARPDVFQLTVNREPRPMLRERSDASPATPFPPESPAPTRKRTRRKSR